jgi:hypothetical protein
VHTIACCTELGTTIATVCNTVASWNSVPVRDTAHTDPNLNVDDDEDLEHRYRTLQNVLDTNTVLGLAHRDIEDAELHNVSMEEPKSFKDADGDPN